MTSLGATKINTNFPLVRTAISSSETWLGSQRTMADFQAKRTDDGHTTKSGQEVDLAA